MSELSNLLTISWFGYDCIRDSSVLMVIFMLLMFMWFPSHLYFYVMMFLICSICGDANARTNVIAELDGTVLDGDHGALPITGLVDEDRWALFRNMFVIGELIRYSEDKG